MNGQYLWKLPFPSSPAARRRSPPSCGLTREQIASPSSCRRWSCNACARARCASSPKQLRPYFAEALRYEEAASRKYLATAGLPELLDELASRWAAAEPWSKERLEELLRGSRPSGASRPPR